MKWFMEQLFGDLEKGFAQPYVSILKMKNLSFLPSATIINALHDPLCDHGGLYAHKLRQNRIPVVHSVYRKSLHGFFGLKVGDSDEAVAEATTALREAFGVSS